MRTEFFVGLLLLCAGCAPTAEKDTPVVEEESKMAEPIPEAFDALLGQWQDGQAVLFDLVNDTDSLVFINPAHDFPDRITYISEQGGTLHAVVSGKEGGTYKSEHYHFIRKNADTAIKVE